MKQLQVITLAVLSLLPFSAQADSFKKIRPHLDTDGTFLAYADFRGDGQKIAETLHEIYADLVVSQPLLAMVQLDFNALFNTLGLGSIHAIGTSSKQLKEGVYANRSALLLQEGKPLGFFESFGNPDSKTFPFTAAKLAPADASVAISFLFQIDSFRKTIVELLGQTMGPMGETLIESQLSQNIPSTEVTYGAAIQALSGKWDLFWHESVSDGFNTTYKVWLRITGAADIVQQLKPLATNLPITLRELEDGIHADLSELLPFADSRLFIETSAKNDTLTLYTHQDWGAESAGPRLNESENFQKLAAFLPKKALSYSYSDAYDFLPVLQEFIQASPDLAPYSAAIEKTFDLFVGDFLKPAVSVAYFDKGTYVTDCYAAYSNKQLTLLLPAAFIGGVGVAAAIPILETFETIPLPSTGSGGARSRKSL
ncbi:MAG: hypothetical protein ACON39_01070 [Coraliomargaritaceae bacterium]